MLSGEVNKPDGYCAACRKHFNTEGAFENHLKSKKHRESAAAFDKRKDKVIEILEMAHLLVHYILTKEVE